MITLLATLAGFVTSTIPELFKFFNSKSDKKHEIELLKLQLEQQKSGHQNRLEEIEATSSAKETESIYQTYFTKIAWVDALNGTVRPIITYAFFILYALVKVLQYHSLGDHAIFFQYLDVLWTEEDQAIFASVIGFYFGQRALTKKNAH